MVDEVKKTGGGLEGTIGTSSADKAKRQTGQIGKDEFLQLLVTQLKNQDPMEPMKNDQFAVNLAQFSQLEQLISINDKVGSKPTEVTSLAGYLGHQVTLDTDSLHVENGDGGSVKLNVPSDAASVKVQLLDKDNKVIEVLDVGALGAGEKVLSLKDIGAPSGDYKFDVKALSATGGELAVKASVVGLVSGFVPGPEPMLIVNGKEVSPSEVLEVSLPTANGGNS